MASCTSAVSSFFASSFIKIFAWYDIPRLLACKSMFSNMYPTFQKARFVFSFQVIMIPDFLLSNSGEISASIVSFMSCARGCPVQISKQSVLFEEVHTCVALTPTSRGNGESQRMRFDVMRCSPFCGP